VNTTGSALRAVPAEARDHQGEPAGIVSRVLANAIDFAVMLAIVTALYFGWAAALFLRRGARFRFPTVSYVEAFLVGSIVLVLYFAVSWRATGRTYGDHLLGLRVVNRDGALLGPGGAIARAVLCVLFPLLLFGVVFSRRRRSVQDVVLGTSVVYDWQVHTVGEAR
jgi:uncharacterized RDD family membrane protein YckC